MSMAGKLLILCRNGTNVYEESSRELKLHFVLLGAPIGESPDEIIQTKCQQHGQSRAPKAADEHRVGLND